MNELRDQEINQLERDKIKLEKRKDFQIRRMKDEKRRREAVENNALQHAVLEVVTDEEMFSINGRFDTILGKHSLGLLTRPFQSAFQKPMKQMKQINRANLLRSKRNLWKP